MNVIFLGTPDFAVGALQRMHKAGFNIVACISQPDREKDRKGKLLFTPVKIAALELGLKVLQPNNVNDQINIIKNLEPDIMVTVAFGQILSDEFLSIAPVFNVHGSLLPKYRGSSPIQTAIINGDKFAGITIMKTIRKMDAGDIILKGKMVIEDTDTYGTLHNKLSVVGADLIVKALQQFGNKKEKYIVQDESKVIFTKKVLKQDGEIDFTNSAIELERKVRAYSPWPSTFIKLENGENVKIHEVKVHKMQSMPDITSHTLGGLDKNYFKNASVGDIFITSKKDKIFVKCKKDFLELINIQAAGKSKMNAVDFLRGNSLPLNLQNKK